MHHFPLRIVFTLFFCLSVFTIYKYSTRDTNSPELRGFLADVQCDFIPKDEDLAKRNRALVTYSDFSYYQLCLPTKLIKNKNMLKCLNGTCSQQAEVQSHFEMDKNDVTYVPDMYGFASSDKKDEKELTSKLTLSLSHAGFGKKVATSDFDSDSSIRFSKKDLRIAKKFGVVDNFICDTKANILNSASCSGILSYNSVQIYVRVEALGEEGTEFSKYELKRQLNHWLRLTDYLVQPLPKE